MTVTAEKQDATVLENPIYVTSIVAPFGMKADQREYYHGVTLQEIYDDLVPQGVKSLGCFITIGGEIINPVYWRHVRPKPGMLIEIRVVPGKGGGKNPLTTILSLAVTLAAPMIAAPIAGALGFTTMTSAGLITWSAAGVAAVNAAVTLAGRLLISAIAPPASDGSGNAGGIEQDTPTLFITGARNVISPGSTVPAPLGKVRMVPPQGALPYTETVGSDQYVRQLFILGYGPLSVSEIKIGETAIEEFEGVEYEILEGTDSDGDLKLFPDTVQQQDLSVELTQSGGWETRTSELNADELSVDLTFPRGLVYFQGGSNKKPATVQVALEYAPTGTSNWSAAHDAYTAISSQAITVDNETNSRVRIDLVVIDALSGDAEVVKGNSRAAGRTARRPPVPESKIEVAQVDIDGTTQVLTDTRDSALYGEQIEDSADFEVTGSSGSYTVATGGISFYGFVVTEAKTSAVRKSIRWSVPNGQYDVRMKRITDDDIQPTKQFDDTTWTALRTITHQDPINQSGIAKLALRMKATGQLNGTVDQLNCIVERRCKDWNGSTWDADVETSNPASIFREVLQGAANARALADARLDLTKLQTWHDDCAAAGREFNHTISSQLGLMDVLQMVAAAGRASPAIIDGLWSVVQDKSQTVPVQHFTPRNSFGFQGQKVFQDLPHALKIPFINRDEGWQQDERIVYDDGYDENNATLFETITLPGITDPEQIWKDGRYHIATARLRPEIYTFQTDVEHIVCTRGDLIKFSHDVALVGLGSGRITAVTDNGTHATSIDLDSQVTMEADKTYGVRMRLADGSTLDEAVTLSVGDVTTLTFEDPVLLANAPAIGDLFMFGESGDETIDLIVKAIEPQNDLTAVVTCIDAAPDVHNADTGTIPDHDPQITTPPDMVRPPAPVIVATQSGDEVMFRNADGSYSVRMAVTLAPPANINTLDVVVEIREVTATDYVTAEYIFDGQTITIEQVAQGESYDVRIRYLNTDHNTFSTWTVISGHTIVGFDGAPDDVTGFSAEVLGETVTLSWDANADIDLSHYRIKFKPATTGATWSNSADLFSSVGAPQTQIVAPKMNGTFLIKAVDLSGNESDNADTLVLDIDSNLNNVATQTEDPSFSGTHSDTQVVSNTLKLDSDETSGTYDFATPTDLGAVFDAIVSVDMTAVGENVGSLIDDWADIDAIEEWDMSADPSTWNVTIQIATTDDDPNGASPTWTAWQNFTQGEYRARGFKFRALLSADDTTVTPAVTALSVSIDMPDRFEGGQGVTGTSSDDPGTSVQFSRAFIHDDPAVVVTPKGMATGDYFDVLSQDRGGFYVAFYNSSGTRVTRDFDWHVQGYGSQASIAPVFYQDETLVLIDEMDVAPTLERKIIINALIGAIKDAGVWDKLDDLYVLAAHDDQAARINWIAPTEELTKVNSPTFQIDEGFDTDGSTSYLQMPNDLDTYSNLSQNDLHFGGYCGGADRMTTRYQLGVAGSNNWRFNVNNNDQRFWSQVNSTAAAATASGNAAASGGSTGHFVADRDGASSLTLYVNGGSEQTESDASAAVPSEPLLINRSNTNYENYRIMNVVHVGAHLTAAEVSDLYDAIVDYIAQVALHEDTETYIDACSATLSNQRKVDLDRIFRSLDGHHTIGNTLDLFYLFGVDDEDDSRINLIAPGTNDLTKTNSPTFTANQGWTGDGGTGYLQTPDDQDEMTNAVEDDMAAGVYSNTDRTSTTEYDFGLIGGSNAFRGNCKYSTVNLGSIGHASWAGGTVSDSLGHHLWTTNGDDAQEVYVEGSSIATDTEASIAPLATPIAVLVHRPGVVGGTQRQIMAFHYGSALDSDQALKLSRLFTWWHDEVLGL